jgi:tetratricopeptide (TPR) repeat protein
VLQLSGQKSINAKEKTVLTKTLKKLVRLALATALAVVPAYSVPALTAQSDATQAIKKGDDYYKNGKYREAIEAFKDALTKDAGNDHAMAYLIYSFNKLGDSASSRDWMRRRVELPGQSPSVKAQTLTDIALLCWDQAHMELAGRRATASASQKSSDVQATEKLLTEGGDSAEKAVAIASKSARAYNLINLIARDSASVESDAGKQKELIAKADEALRQCIKVFEASPAQQQSNEQFVAPTITLGGFAPAGDSFQLGAPTKKVEAKGAAVAVEVLVGRDGKVRFARALGGASKAGDAAAAAGRQWEFKPSTFESHAVQVLQVVTFPVK